ncbi:hypothetical protein ACFPAF_17035 [Hymenobacter endophyticus]|uniref:Uncharacterized protein n=1 Tax=Hymenobacter endophyticus TaxID=3076335 RepID=A0ABU3TL84_9BACT|nr:hypothetical protein [Hymenobacter endophyticus]MDU0372110.1 hypothetical protein [Hymenobacter endophyticus]
MGTMYQLVTIHRQAQLVASIAAGSHLEQLQLGMYVREWTSLLREARLLPLPRHQQPRVAQALTELEALSRLAHGLPWQQVQAGLLAVARLVA